jgi:hypothetical protein
MKKYFMLMEVVDIVTTVFEKVNFGIYLSALSFKYAEV